MTWLRGGGLWNLIFYPFLGQWWSFAGGVFLVTMNFIWFGQLYYYLNSERGQVAQGGGATPPSPQSAR